MTSEEKVRPSEMSKGVQTSPWWLKIAYLVLAVLTAEGFVHPSVFGFVMLVVIFISSGDGYERPENRW